LRRGSLSAGAAAVTFSGVTALSSTFHEENLSNPSIAFPLRLQRGLLQKTDEREAYLLLLGIMARTPRSSWAGHASFGFNEFFSEFAKQGISQESRTRIAETTAKEINAVLADLGLTHYRVDSIVIDPFEKEVKGGGQERWTGHVMEQRGVTLMLREISTDRATRCVL
jgi:hypothetical protein